MLLSLDRRLLFIKGVKVAGTSLELFLEPQLEEGVVVTPMGDNEQFANSRPRNFKNPYGERFYDHMPATVIRHNIGVWLYERLFKFGIVRNPYEKIRSLHIMELDRSGPRAIDETISECASEAERVCDGGSMIVHKLLMYENLDSELADLLPTLGLSFPGTLNIRARSDPRRAYRGPPITFSAQQIARIRNKFEFEFRFYEQRRQLVEP